jgi:hypothetical protein
MRTSIRVVVGTLMFGMFAMPAWGQQAATPDMTTLVNGYERAAHSSFVGIPTDWSTSHVVFSAPEPNSDAEDQAQQDPRYWMQQIRRAQLQADDSQAEYSTDWSSADGAVPDKKKNKKPKKAKKAKKTPIKKDWSASLGGTGAKVGAGFFPAKFTYGTTTASCTDYVAFNTSLAASATQASVISFTNIYTGCGGTVPTTAWAFNTGGTVSTSITPSFDGTQVAFVESVGTTATLVLLKWNAGPAANHALTLTLNSTTAVVATAGTFSAADVGAQITVTGTGIPAGDTIAAVTNSTHATLATAATVSASRAATVHAETAVLPGVAPTVANGSYRACTAPCMTTIAFNGTPNDTNSSPYYVFGGPDADAIFAGDDTGHVHKFTGVFLGSPAEVTTGGFPVTAAIEKLSGPVYNSVAGTVEIDASYDGTNNGARLHEIAVDAGTPTVLDSSILGNTTAGGTNCAATTVATGTALTLDAPIVDASAGAKGIIYVFIGNDGVATPNSAVYQFAPGFTEHTCGNKVTIGTGSTTSGIPVYSGSFDALYFAAAPTGNLYVCGNAGGNAQLWRIPITTSTNALGTPVAITTTLSTAGTTCSPVTEFQNGAVDQAYVSVEASGRPAGCGGTGCVMNFTITSALPASATPLAVLPESGGTSGIVVDNSSAFTGASQLYFSTLGGASAVQAAQGL